jgi:hypothetical protein
MKHSRYEMFFQILRQQEGKITGGIAELVAARDRGKRLNLDKNSRKTEQ